MSFEDRIRESMADDARRQEEGLLRQAEAKREAAQSAAAVMAVAYETAREFAEFARGREVPTLPVHSSADSPEIGQGWYVGHVQDIHRFWIGMAVTTGGAILRGASVQRRVVGWLGRRRGETGVYLLGEVAREPFPELSDFAGLCESTAKRILTGEFRPDGER